MKSFCFLSILRVGEVSHIQLLLNSNLRDYGPPTSICDNNYKALDKPPSKEMDVHQSAFCTIFQILQWLKLFRLSATSKSPFGVFFIGFFLLLFVFLCSGDRERFSHAGSHLTLGTWALLQGLVREQSLRVGSHALEMAKRFYLSLSIWFCLIPGKIIDVCRTGAELEQVFHALLSPMNMEISWFCMSTCGPVVSPHHAVCLWDVAHLYWQTISCSSQKENGVQEGKIYLINQCICLNFPSSCIPGLIQVSYWKVKAYFESLPGTAAGMRFQIQQRHLHVRVCLKKSEKLISWQVFFLFSYVRLRNMPKVEEGVPIPKPCRPAFFCHLSWEYHAKKEGMLTPVAGDLGREDFGAGTLRLASSPGWNPPWEELPVR